MQGNASIKPTLVDRIVGFTDDLFRASGDRLVSIDCSVLAVHGTVGLAHSGRLMQGHSNRKLSARQPLAMQSSVDFHTGDDTDASRIVGRQGMIHAPTEDEGRAFAATSASGAG